MLHDTTQFHSIPSGRQVAPEGVRGYRRSPSDGAMRGSQANPRGVATVVVVVAVGGANTIVGECAGAAGASSITAMDTSETVLLVYERPQTPA